MSSVYTGGFGSITGSGIFWLSGISMGSVGGGVSSVLLRIGLEVFLMSRFISIGIIRLSTKNGYPRIQELISESETFCLLLYGCGLLLRDKGRVRCRVACCRYGFNNSYDGRFAYRKRFADQSSANR